VLDCADAFDNNGCSGGLPSHAFEYIKDIGGLQYETDYPYLAEDNECKYNAKFAGISIPNGSVNIT